MLFYLTLITLIFRPNFSEGFAADEITDLPGLARRPTFRQYSGYLNTTKGNYLHYWFVESQSNPDKDPLILWLSGGPGCSSLTGLFSENGPFRVADNNQTLTEAPNSWNQLGNVLYLESPVGVGFSYSDDKTFHNSDNLTAEYNYLALLSFFEKFPKFKTNSFYITGESYAGVYIPTLALKIFQNELTFNLKGLSIGNGLMDIKILQASRVEYAYTHGFISSLEWNRLQTNCCSCRNGSAQVCEYEGPDCTPMYENLDNLYNILNECSPIPNTDTELTDSTDITDSQYLMHLKKYFGFDLNYLKQLNDYYKDKPKCESDAYKIYLKSMSVRKALHIPDQVQEWHWLLNDTTYEEQYLSMTPIVKELVEKYKIQTIIIYNGDLDSVCDFIGDQQFVDELGFKLKDKYQKWTVDGRTAGFVKRFEGITFMTVRGAGHMVPTDQPEAGLAIIKELIGVSKVN